jgi:CsoR family transcriptional regulator, copper-sensing transcriptional repressor
MGVYCSFMIATKKPKLEARLKRVAGQVAGLQKMVTEDRYCVDILTQLAAVRSALDAIGIELLSNHVEHCVSGCAAAHPAAKEKSHAELVDEVRLTLSRFLR